MSIKSVMPSNHLILFHPLALLPSIFPSIRVFSNESVLCIRWSNYWSFNFSISPSNEYSRLISFRIDWLDLLAVQGTLKSLLQHHSSKASILWRSAFFMVQLSYPYMTTGKTIALTRWTFVGKGPGSSLIAQLVKNPPAIQEFGSVAQSYPTLSDPMNSSSPVLPVHHQLLEFSQTHVHRVSDAIQPSHPLSSFSSCPQSLPASESFPMSQPFA